MQSGKKKSLPTEVSLIILKLHPDRPYSMAFQKFCLAYCCSIPNPLLPPVKQQLFTINGQGLNNFRYKLISIFTRPAPFTRSNGDTIQCRIFSYLANGMKAGFKYILEKRPFHKPAVHQAESFFFS